MKILKIVLIVMILDVVLCEDPQKVLKMMSRAIGNAVLECKQEVDFDQQIIDDLIQYWQREHPLTTGEIGCVLYCVATKLHLVEREGSLKKDNAVGFGKSNGADETIINRLSSAYQECKASVGFAEPCSAMLKIATCFREKVFLFQWAPKPGMLYEDYNDDFYKDK